MMGCKHKKNNKRCLWCHACGAKRAGPKPKPTFEVGWWATTEHLNYPGRIGAVNMILLGLGVEHQEWSEEVVIINGSEEWRGPAQNVMRLVAANKKG